MQKTIKNLPLTVGKNFFTHVANNNRGMFCYALTYYLADYYNIDNIHVYTVNKGSSHHWKRNGTHEIRFKWEHIRSNYDLGFWEYKTVRAIWYQLFSRGNTKTGRFLEADGYMGLTCLVYHEFAHLLQTEKGHKKVNGRWDIHGPTFLVQLQKLLNEHNIEELTNQIICDDQFAKWHEIGLLH